jgi:hypothetical protein
MSELDPRSYDGEVRERWGDTESYRESARRTKRYTEADWVQIKGEAEAIESGFASALAAGEPADGERALGLAEAARAHIDRWFYPCSPRMHSALADMYTADPRFRAHYDDRVEGLAEYVSSAIKANAVERGS